MKAWNYSGQRHIPDTVVGRSIVASYSSAIKNKGNSGLMQSNI